MKRLLTIIAIASSLSCKKTIELQTPVTFSTMAGKNIDCKTCYLQTGLSATFCYNYCRFLEKLGKGEVE